MGMDWRRPRVNGTTGDRAAVENRLFHVIGMRNDSRMPLEKGEVFRM
jgi:hypothetical protein